MRALIVGAGVAGAATAITLKKIGWDPIVFEAYEQTAEGVGAFLMLATNGLDALAAFDTKEQVRRRGTDTPKMVFHSHTGRRLGSASFGGRHADGTATQMIDRSDLYGALIEEAGLQGVPFEYGKRFTGLKTSDDGVRIEFEDGTYADGDILIGADGLWSKVRKIVDPDAPEPHEIASVSAGGVAEEIEIDGEPGEWHAYFGKKTFFGYTVRPDKRVAWFINPPCADLEYAQGLCALTEQEWRTELIKMVEVDRSPAVRLVNATTEIYPPGIDHAYPPTRPWYGDKVILIGDAAHPTPPAGGQGASMAVEDAVVLAQCLRDIKNVQKAFAAFDTLRRQRVIDVIDSAKKLDVNQQSLGPVGSMVRNIAIAIALWNDKRAIRKTGAAKTTAGMRWLWDHHLEWDKPAAP
jgi:FAD-dependent urate hydroxylase